MLLPEPGDNLLILRQLMIQFIPVFVIKRKGIVDAVEGQLGMGTHDIVRGMPEQFIDGKIPEFPGWAGSTTGASFLSQVLDRFAILPRFIEMILPERI